MRAASSLALLALTIMFAGCSVLPERPPSPALHDFGPISGPSTPMQDASAPVSVSAPEWLLDDRIHYRFAFDDPTRVRHYNLDRWLAPPSALLAQRLAGGTAAAMRLRVRLQEFEQIFDTPAKARVVIRLRATFEPVSSETAKRAREFRLTRLCPTPDARGAVSAFAALVEEAVGMVQAWTAEQSGKPAHGSGAPASP